MLSASAAKRILQERRNLVCPDIIPLTLAESILKKACEESFHEFVKAFWNTIEGSAFCDNWHISILCQHLELCYEGVIKDLIINIPPRTMKSTLMSMFTAWVWTKKPQLKFLCLAGTKSLSIAGNIRCREILNSALYKKLWGDSVQLKAHSKAKQKFENTKGGYRITFSMNSSIRGEGGNFIIVDDGNTDMDCYSDVMRNAKNEFIDFSVSTRTADPRSLCFINVQQRLHQFDITGHLLSKKTKRVHLCLPMEFESERVIETVPLKGMSTPWKDPRRTEGELLWPEFLTEEVIERLKDELNSEFAIAGQFQQRPVPKDGGLIKANWFRIWKDKHLPELMSTIQSWDTAILTHAKACYSASTTWGIFQDENQYNNLILLNAWRGKLEYPDLKEMIRRQSCDYHCSTLQGDIKHTRRPDLILMEAAANGMPLIQDLRKSGISILPFNPRKFGFKSTDGNLVDHSKFARATIISSLIEGGFVWVPAEPPSYERLVPFARSFLEAASGFPRGDGADWVDSMSQAFLYLMKTNNMIYRNQKVQNDLVFQDVHSRSQLMEKSRHAGFYNKI